MNIRAPRSWLPVDTLRHVVACADRFVGHRFVAASVLVVTGGVVAALAPLALKDMVDVVARTAQTPDHAGITPMLAPAAAYLIALVVARLLSELRPLLASAAEQRLCARLTTRCFEHLLSLPMSWHTAQRTGAVVQLVRQATMGTQVLLANLVSVVGPVIVELATIIIVMTYLGQTGIVFAFLAAAIGYLGVFTAGAKPLRACATQVSGASQTVQATLAEGLQNCETIKCCGAETMAVRRLRTGTDAVEAGWAQLHRQRARIGFGAAAVFAVSVSTALLLAIQAVSDGSMSIGGFVLATVYLLQVLRPLESLVASARDLLQALAWIRPLVDLLAMAPEPGRRTLPSPEPGSAPAPREPHRWTSTAPSIRFRHVSFAYEPRRPVLSDLDLDIKPGSTVGIVGMSGSGKSSLTRLLLRLFEPTQGQVLLDDVPLGQLSLETLREQISLVPQDITLFNDTIAANIALGQPGCPPKAVEYASRLACLHGFVDQLPDRYDTVVGERGLELSGGERQRIAIARAILRCPRVYLLDEATSMLDSATEAAILDNLRELTAGCTTLMIAHRLTSVVHADEIVVLERGRVVERGTHAQLFEQGCAYARLWSLQNSAPPCESK